MAERQAWVIHDPKYVDALPVVVHVHDTVADLHDWYREHDRSAMQGGWAWDAITTPRLGDGRDDELGDCFEVHFGRDVLWTSVIVHEATHVGLLMYAYHRLARKHRRARALAHIERHTEQMPETIGNLSAHMLILLRREFPDDVDREDGVPGIPMT